MANLPESASYDGGVYQIETADPVQGGAAGVSNNQGKNLANRTTWLKQQVDSILSQLLNLAGLNSPALTGTPTAPTAALGNSTTQLATTAFVQNSVNGVLSKSVAGGSNVTLTAVEAGNGILVFTGLLTANIAVIVPATGKSWIVSNQTTGAFTLTVKTAAGTGIAVTQNRNSELYCDATNVLQSTTDFVSPATTGNPTAPTAASGDNSASIASTGFVFGATDGLSTVNVAGNSDVTLTQAQYGTAIVKITGALTGHINLIMPSQSGQWVIDNSTTGSFNVTAKTAAGTGEVLPQGSAVLVYGDGVNIDLASSSGQASFKKQEFTPANGTTSLTVLGGFTPGNNMVEKNGAWLQSADFDQTTSPNIGLTVAANGTDVFVVYSFASFTVADAVLRSGDTMAGALALAANSTAPTATPGDSSTKIANTAFVNAEIAADVLAMFVGANQLLAADGYQKLPGGWIVQWMSDATFRADGADVVKTFPVAFIEACYVVLPVMRGVSSATLSDSARSTTSCTVSVRTSSTPGFNLLAIGK